MTKQTIPAEAAGGFIISEAEPATIALDAIKRDEALICRARGINAGTVREYSEAMKAGATFPPVVVFRDARGGCWLADGFHRCGAAELAGFVEIAADVRDGGRREALLHAASANAAHGLRRTNADKRRAVALVLKSFPKWSDRKIGDACGVDHKTVARLRPAPTGEIPHDEREGTDGKARRAPSFDAERETARVEKTIAGLAERWPVDARPRFYELVTAWLARVGEESPGTKGAKARESERSRAEQSLDLKTHDKTAGRVKRRRLVKANAAPDELVKEAS